MIDLLHPDLRNEVESDGERLLGYPGGASPHEYEVERLHMDGATFDADVFYLCTGEPVNINVEDGLTDTNLSTEPGETCPSKEDHVIFEVAPSDYREPVERCFNRFDAELEQSNP